MLSESHLELLTAFVDGELTRRQRKAVLRLLHLSSEARAVLRDLQEIAHRLRALPRRSLGSGFAEQVVQIIDERHLRPAAEAPAPRRRPRWIALAAAAACVLIAVGVSIYVANDRSDNGRVAQVERGALRLTFGDLAQEPKRKLLADRLEKEPAVHLDLTVLNNAAAVAQLRELFKGQGIKLLVDARVDAEFKQALPSPAGYLVYAENMRADELKTILQQLGGQPKNPAAAKPNFKSMVVTSISSADRQNLSALLGVDAKELAAPAAPDKPNLFDVDIIEAPAGKNKQPAPAPRLDRFAMVLASQPVRGAASAEVKAFLAGRQQLRPGTLQVLLVIRQA
jgi:hypothetical protein